MFRDILGVDAVFLWVRRLEMEKEVKPKECVKKFFMASVQFLCCSI